MNTRTWWLLLPALVLAGAGVGVGIAYAVNPPYHARAAVLITATGAKPETVRPFLPDLRVLATSSVVAGNVDSTLRLPESTEQVRQKLHASIRSGTQVIELTASDAKGDRARAIAQEAAIVFTQLVSVRFASATPPLDASVLDPAHVLLRKRHPLRDGLVGGAIGLAAVAAVVFGFVRRRPQIAPRPDRELRRRETDLDRRVAAITERERALARRAGELAALERAAVEQPLPASPPPPPPEPPPVAPPPVEAPAPAPAPTAAVGTAWNLTELERLVRDHADSNPDAIDEWNAYLFYLRDYAAADGSLPPSFDALVDEVFGGLVP